MRPTFQRSKQKGIISLTRRDLTTVSENVYHLAVEMATITKEILPGQTGRLHYRAAYWIARAIDNSYIARGTVVRPVMRKGNTWYVSVNCQYPPQQAVS
ncbi:MAG: hypothetical protein AAFW75_09985 [Cyanobacteria bacterium J06636_16]